MRRRTCQKRKKLEGQILGMTIRKQAQTTQ
jgi:hypothetical protein